MYGAWSTHTHTHLHIDAHESTHTCIHVFCIPTYVHLHTHVYKHTQMPLQHVYTHVSTHEHAPGYICTHWHTYLIRLAVSLMVNYEQGHGFLSPRIWVVSWDILKGPDLVAVYLRLQMLPNDQPHRASLVWDEKHMKKILAIPLVIEN